MIARAYRDGRRPPSYDACYAHVRGRLAAVWRAHDVDAFRRNPRRDGMLLERLDGADVPPEVVDGIRVRLPALVRRLIAHPVWEQVRDCGRGDVVLCDALDAMLVEIGDTAVRVYAAPDLCFVTRSALHVPTMGVPIPAGSPVLVDWKTGNVGDWLLQLSIYAWFVRDHLAIPPGPLGYVGRVGDLAGPDQDALGGQIVLIGDAEIARGRAVVERAVRQVVAWSGPDGRLVRDRMPIVEAACRFCPMRSLCSASRAGGPNAEHDPTQTP